MCCFWDMLRNWGEPSPEEKKNRPSRTHIEKNARMPRKSPWILASLVMKSSPQTVRRTDAKTAEPPHEWTEREDGVVLQMSVPGEGQVDFGGRIDFRGICQRLSACQAGVHRYFGSCVLQGRGGKSAHEDHYHKQGTDNSATLLHTQTRHGLCFGAACGWRFTCSIEDDFSFHPFVHVRSEHETVRSLAETRHSPNCQLYTRSFDVRFGDHFENPTLPFARSKQPWHRKIAAGRKEGSDCTAELGTGSLNEASFSEQMPPMRQPERHTLSHPTPTLTEQRRR